MKKIIAALISLVTLIAISRFSMNKYYKDIYSRFPDFDKKIARKALRKLLWNSFMQKNGDIQDLTDEEMDRLYIDVYMDIYHQKH